MASLRRKPDGVVASVDPVNSVAIGIDSNPPPTPPPAPITPPSETGAEQALLAQLNALRQSESLQQQHHQQQQAEGRRRDWLQNNPLAQQHYAALNNLHGEAVQAGHADTSDGYFSFLNDRLAALHTERPAANGVRLIEEMQQRAAPAQSAPQPRQRTNIVSAPVSREVPTASGSRDGGKITLSNEQKEAAKIAGITETEYARQLLRLNGMKASGEYSERQ
jgi:hypothetical protein